MDHGHRQTANRAPGLPARCMSRPRHLPLTGASPGIPRIILPALPAFRTLAAERMLAFRRRDLRPLERQPLSCRKSVAPSARRAPGRHRTPGPGSGRHRTSRSRGLRSRWSVRNSSRSSAHRPLLRPCDAPGPASAAAAPSCPPRRRSHSGLVGLRTRRDRRLPPLANTAGDDSADAARGLPPPRNRRFRPGPDLAAGCARPAGSVKRP